MRLGVNLLLDCLVQSDDGVSYCTLKSQRVVKRRDERLTMDEEIDASFNSCDLSRSKHGSAGHLRLFPFVLP